MLEGNKITIRTNRFTNHPSIMIREYTCIQMKKYLKSIKSANEKFTNYASSAAAKKYKKVDYDLELPILEDEPLEALEQELMD